MKRQERDQYLKGFQFPTFPHCDAKALHAPGKCVFCDKHPDWQLLRIVYDIAFTGEDPEDARQFPDPAKFARPTTFDKWGGNVARPA